MSSTSAPSKTPSSDIPPQMERVGIEYEDRDYLQKTLESLNTLRRNRQFCDIVLLIGSHEIYGHRAVLACASPYLFNLFAKDTESGNHVYRVKLNGGFERESFEKLVNYAYTARLDISADQVRTTYITAVKLKMDRAARKCGEHLMKHLKPKNCIGIRSIPGIAFDTEFVTAVDNFIEREVEEVMKCKELHALPRVQVEVLRNSKEEIEVVNNQQLCSMVLEWIKQGVDDDELQLESLSERVYMLYVDRDHSLRDCNQIQNGDFNDSEIIQDYKKMCRIFRTPSNKGRKKMVAAPVPAKPRQLLYSRSISENSLCLESGEEFIWKLIAVKQTGANVVMSIAVVNGQLFLLTVAQRLNEIKSSCPPSPLPVDVVEDICPLPPMSSARCAVGTAAFNGKLLVCGGYDRGECLKTVQEYDPRTNCWQSLASMRHSRGRFSITVVGDKAFAIAGCNGNQELNSVECLDELTQKWTMSPPLEIARSNAGVCSLDDKIYCIGGWNGQSGTKRCDVYDPETKSWLELAPLLTGRYQAGVCAFNGMVYTCGGCDTWNCLNTVEKYDPKTDVWTFISPMTTSRRGCGAAAFNGKIYVVGGSDGSRSLCTTEMYDPETNAWSAGPSMTSSRANVSIAVVDGKLYAVGGFTGKVFLNTVEFLDPRNNEWTTFTSRLNIPEGECVPQPQQNGGDHLKKSGELLAEHNGVSVGNGLSNSKKSELNNSVSEHNGLTQHVSNGVEKIVQNGKPLQNGVNHAENGEKNYFSHKSTDCNTKLINGMLASSSGRSIEDCKVKDC